MHVLLFPEHATDLHTVVGAERSADPPVLLEIGSAYIARLTGPSRATTVQTLLEDLP